MNDERIIKTAYGNIDLPDSDMYSTVLMQLSEQKRRQRKRLKPTVLIIIALAFTLSITAVAIPVMIYPNVPKAVVISAAPHQRYIDIVTMEQISGIPALYSHQPTMTDAYQKFLVSLMAGDPNIDIYILSYHEDVTQGLIRNSQYVPLGASSPIRNYLDRCFDWVGETATTPDGEIWMLPIAYDASLLWYVPENFEHFELKPTDVAYYDDYIKTLERINPVKGDYTTFALFPSDHIFMWQTQYDMANGVSADYTSPAFKSLFASWWGGWNRAGNPNVSTNHHPIFGYDSTKYFESVTSQVLPVDYNEEQVIFKLEFMSSKLNRLDPDSINQWRTLQMPRVSREVERNYVLTHYAVVNPYGKNRELAVAYLETLSENMLSAITLPAFVLKDPNDYEGHYDMDIAMYMDLHDIFRYGGTGGGDSFGSLYTSQAHIDDYQAGKITLDEAVDIFQRQVDMWRHE